MGIQEMQWRGGQVKASAPKIGTCDTPADCALNSHITFSCTPYDSPISLPIIGTVNGAWIGDWSPVTEPLSLLGSCCPIL